MAEDTASPRADSSSRGAEAAAQFTTLMLKAYAHPLRRGLLRELERAGSGRAADLARTLDAPANAISFHLRTLAEAGLIHEDASLARDRRDRVWVRTLGVPGTIGGPDARPADADLAGVAALAVIDDVRVMLDRIARRIGHGDLADIDQDASVISSHRHLTDEQFRRAMDAFGAVLEDEKLGEGHGPRPGAKFYEIAIILASESL